MPFFSRQRSVPQTTVPQPPQKRYPVWALRFLILLGVVALAYGGSWWWSEWQRTAASPWLLIGAALLGVYIVPQMIGVWILYAAARRRVAPPPRPEGLSVDVFVAACGEPCDLVEASLGAACRMRGEHRTFLLDDASDPDLARLAQRLGAEYLARPDRTNAKAGNLNAALPRTQGDVIAIFDIDHVPRPDFLERTVGYFADPSVGFVQAMLTFRNAGQSWIAHAAVETSHDFYNSTSLGMNALGGTTMMGSNSLIRRRALEQIGGYRAGLAEDLATSLALHAAGWRSAYAADPLGPGLAPATSVAWFTQQLKWARGVFEVLVKDYPRLFGRLTWGQRLAYGVRMTYYWCGTLIGVHLGVTLAALWGGSDAFRNTLQQYLLHMAPLAVLFVLIQHVAVNVWRHPEVVSDPLWRAVALVYFTWPTYLLAWVMALLRRPLAFRMTPKDASGWVHPVWYLPQVAIIGLLAAGAGLLALRSGGGLAALARYPVLIGFVLAQCAVPLVVLGERLRPQRWKKSKTTQNPPWPGIASDTE